MSDEPNPLKFNPIPWVADTVYELAVDMRTGGSGTDPVSLISLVLTPETFEHISNNFTLRGAVGGPLDRAGSPSATTATFLAYYNSHNVTLATEAELPNADRFKALLQVFNDGRNPTFVGLGDDPLIIEGMRVSTIDNIED